MTVAKTAHDSLPRLLTALFFGNTVMLALYVGVAGILIQSHLAEIDPANKVANVGLVAGVSAIFATVFNPIGGTLSDRTRSRFGRRNPWMIGGALAALGAMALLGQADSVLLVLLAWCAGQSVMNLYQAALTAIVPDRVPENRRGTASAVVGLATNAGLILGSVVAAAFVTDIPLGYLIFGAAVVAGAIVVTLSTHDPRPGEYDTSVRRSGGLGRQLADFVSALGHHDFLWVFLGRATFMLGYFMIFLYTLFIFTDYIKLPAGLAPATAVALLTVTSVVTGAIAMIIAGPLSDRMDRRKAFVVVAGVVAALAMLIPLFAPTWPAMIVYGVVHGAAFGVYGAVDIAIVTLVLPSQGDAARDMGILNIANAGPQIAAPALASLVITAFGGYAALFVAGVCISLVGALAVLPIRSIR
ncbi:MFS transporter [Nonomuraea typhae]|uniref:MFS transporter n=1 Tax=Nonomuraea typhae TaxID=2603600 RepID=UPI001CA5350E|nr:MFS transporter [Nonomuraea typhae]